MSGRNESNGGNAGPRASTSVWSVVSYVLCALAFASVSLALQIGYSLFEKHWCTPAEASALAWHWFARGPLWVFCFALVWVTGRLLINRRL